MTAAWATEDGELRLSLEPVEAQLLADLFEQLAELLGAEGLAADPVFERLFPRGYRDDPDAADEFERFTRAGLREGKARDAETVARTLAARWAHPDDDVVLDLDDDERWAWMRGLTDLRLVLAERLGAGEGEQVAPDDDPSRAVHDWLGAVQGLLVEAADDALPERTEPREPPPAPASA